MTFNTASKDVKVIEITFSVYGTFAWIDDKTQVRGGLEPVIQYMANKGFDFVGKVDEFKPTGTIAQPSKSYLFTRAKTEVALEGDLAP